MKTNRNVLGKLTQEASILFDKGDFASAIFVYEKALCLSPNDAFLLYCLGVSHHRKLEFFVAIDYYSKALKIKSNFVEAFENLASAQWHCSLFDDALISVIAAIDLSPQKLSNYIFLAKILNRLGRSREAIDVTNHINLINPNLAEVHAIRSAANRSLNNTFESISDLKKAISLDPDNPEYVLDMSFDLLLSENFKDGWLAYEFRLKTANFSNKTIQGFSPLWDGIENISNKTIFICPEQGLGDQIQFSRYALLLKRMGAKVIFSVEPCLVDLMKSLDPDILVISSHQMFEEIPKHDFHLPLMSLLGIFNTNLSNIPSFNRYLNPSRAISEKWQVRFEDKTKLQVGIAWSGSSKHVNDHNRSLRLLDLEPLYKLNANWHILQIDISPHDEIQALNTSLKDWRPQLTNFNETAGLIDNLDLVISVDTSIAHLSAALGKDTWILLPYAPDFRWLLNRSDSPWYPSVKLFRQSQPKDWAGVISSVIDQFNLYTQSIT